MGFILSVFRAAPETPKLNDQDKVVLDIKRCRDNLKNYIKRLQKDSNLNRDKAKELLRNNNRDSAKIFLNKSKMCNTHINTYLNQLNLLEDQLANMQMSIQQKETFEIIGRGNEILKQLQKDVNLEKLENLSEEFNDLKQNQEEVSNFLKTYSITSQEFEADVENDLNKMIEETSPLPDTSFPEVKTNNEYKNDTSQNNRVGIEL
jgi:charged multivesicular body protein 6